MACYWASFTFFFFFFVASTKLLLMCKSRKESLFEHHTTDNYPSSCLNPRIVYTVIPTCTIIKQTMRPLILLLIIMSHINLIGFL
jgi:hypothetical protein